MDLSVELVKLVGRSLYEAKYCVFFDCLLRERVVPDDVLADRLRFMVKDITRMAAKLREDRLIKTLLRQEIRPYDERTITRAYHYIDFALFSDVVKYRLHRMRAMLEEKTREEALNHGYYCPQCKRQYSPLDVATLINLSTSLFECEDCKIELLNTESTFKGDSLRLQSRLSEQTNGILRILRKLDEVVIPPFDPEEYLKGREGFDLIDDSEDSLSMVSSRNSSLESFDRPAASSRADSSKAFHISPKPLEVEIVSSHNKIQSGTDHRSQTLPEWHTHSTVTGEEFKSTASKPISSLLNASTSSLPPLKEALPETENFAMNYYASLPDMSVGATIDGSNIAAKRLKVTETILVNVAGNPKNINDIADEDKDLMTEEEYQHYYEAYMKLENTK